MASISRTTQTRCGGAYYTTSIKGRDSKATLSYILSFRPAWDTENQSKAGAGRKKKREKESWDHLREMQFAFPPHAQCHMTL